MSTEQTTAIITTNQRKDLLYFYPQLHCEKQLKATNSTNTLHLDGDSKKQWTMILLLTLNKSLFQLILLANINTMVDRRHFLCSRMDQLHDNWFTDVQYMANSFAMLQRQVSALQTAGVTSINTQMERLRIVPYVKQLIPYKLVYLPKRPLLKLLGVWMTVNLLHSCAVTHPKLVCYLHSILSRILCSIVVAQ